MAGNRASTKTQSSPAPVGGLNVRDSITNMPPTDALTLVNWIPQQYGLRCRKGYREWCIGLGNEIKTIFSYAPARANVSALKVFASTDSGIFDVTAQTNAPIAMQTLSGGTDAGRFSTAMLSNIAGTFLLAASAAGGYMYFDGTSWVIPTMGAGAGQVNGVDPTKFTQVCLWKRRSWFIEKNTTRAWISPVDSLTGTFTSFDFGPLMPHGGALSFLANWTIDAGEGIDDYLVVAGENGDVIIYKGVDPTDVSTFAMVGHWYVGRLPVGQRGFCQLGGDLLVLSEMGLQPLSYVTRGGQTLLRSSSVDYLAKIQPAISDAITASADEVGWEVVVVQSENLLIIQRPVGVTPTNQQFVLYTNLNRWCIFDGYAMTTSCPTALGYFYGTSDGKVMLGLDGYFDAIPYGSNTGNGIQGAVQPRYSFFGAPGANKQWHMVRPTFLATDKPGVSVQMFADYDSVSVVASPAYSTSSGSKWDVDLWDEATWGGAQRTYADWYSVNAIGYIGSAYLSTVCVGDTYLVQMDYMYEYGGSL